MDIREFSALLGVSCSTVSRAFSGRGRVSEQTRALIFEKAVEFGYRPKGYRLENNIPFARDMVVILYTLPKMDLYCDYMFTEVFCSIRETLEKSGLAASPHVIFESASTLESFYFDLFNADNIKGLIWFTGTKFYSRLKDRIAYWNKPNIGIGMPKWHCDNNIGLDIHSAGRQIGEYFRKIRRRYPAMVVGNYDATALRKWKLEDIPAFSKEAGYLEGLQLSAKDVFFIPGGYRFEDGYNAFLHMRGSGRPVDCVFCASDTLAAGFLCAANEAGVKVPEELAIFGFDNVPFSRFTTPALSTVEFPKQEIGRLAANAILAMIDGVNSRPVEMTYKGNLILRNSA